MLKFGMHWPAVLSSIFSIKSALNYNSDSDLGDKKEI